MPITETDALANMLAASDSRIDVLAEHVGEVKADVRQVRAGVDELRSALAVLVRHEVRMDSNAAELGALRAELTAQGKCIHEIQVQMPQLMETRGLIMRGVLAVIGAVGVAVLAVVVRK